MFHYPDGPSVSKMADRNKMSYSGLQSARQAKEDGICPGPCQFSANAVEYVQILQRRFSTCRMSGMGEAPFWLCCM